MLPSLARQSATVLRPRWVADNRGNKIANFDPPESSVVVAGCSVQPSAGAEDTNGRDAVLGAYTVWMPPGTDVKARDRISIGGRDYDVVGEPLRWATGVLDHVQISANLWEG